MLMQIIDLYKIFLRYPKISTDSRNPVPDSLFFALKGESFNGNRFALDALKAGCAYAIVDEFTEEIHPRVIIVDDCIQTLQELAAYHRKKTGIPVLAITGSNGKTTTKELLSKVLATQFNLISTEGNLNNHIGVPLTLLRISRETEIAVIEMGANHIGEIAVLCRIADPDYAVITNIGKAHLEGFGSPEGVKKAKGEMYEYIIKTKGRIFINWDNPILRSLVDKKQVDLFKYGTSDECECMGGIESVSGELKFGFYHSDTRERYSVSTRIFGGYNFENALCACAVGTFFRIPPKEIVTAIESYEPKNNRSQCIQTKRNFIVMDAYNANPTSMKIAIEEFMREKRPNQVMILGDMFEMGEYSSIEHESIIKIIDNLEEVECFLVGSCFQKAAGGRHKSFLNVRDLIAYLETSPLNGRNILIKGSRGVQLEKCLEHL